MDRQLRKGQKFKVLCISDHVDPLVYSESIKKRFGDVNFVLSCGDLPFNYYDYIVSTLNKPLFFVFGNHNLKKIGLYNRKYRKFKSRDYIIKHRYYPGGTYIGKKIVTYKGLIIVGFGGSMWYNGGLNQFTDRQMYLSMLWMIPHLLWNRIFKGRYVDILVTHAPPFRIHDKPDRCHTGFRAFIWFIKKFKPRLHVHGHVHIYNINLTRETQFLNTRIVNAYDHRVVEFEL